MHHQSTVSHKASIGSNYKPSIIHCARTSTSHQCTLAGRAAGANPQESTGAVQADHLVTSGQLSSLLSAAADCGCSQDSSAPGDVAGSDCSVQPLPTAPSSTVLTTTVSSSITRRSACKQVDMSACL